MYIVGLVIVAVKVFDQEVVILIAQRELLWKRNGDCFCAIVITKDKKQNGL